MSKRKGFVIADIHYGKKDDIKLTKDLEQFFFSKIEEKKDETDFVIVAGDLFDKALKLTDTGSVMAFNFVMDLINYAKKYNFKVRIIKGTKTHDLNQLKNFYKLEVENFETFKIIETISEESLYDDLSVLYVPEEYMSNPKEFYSKYLKEDLTEEDGKYDFIFFHGMFDFVGYVPDVESERHISLAPTFSAKLFSENVYGAAIGGHIHDLINYDKVYYTGSFERFTFKDKKPKGYYFVEYDTENGECNLEFIENTNAEKYVTFNLNELDGTLEEKLETLKDLKDSFKNIRIIANEANNEEIEAIKKISKGIEGVKLNIKREENDTKVESKFDFILNQEYSEEETIQKFIKLEHDLDISLDDIIKYTTEVEKD